MGLLKAGGNKQILENFYDFRTKSLNNSINFYLESRPSLALSIVSLNRELKSTKGKSPKEFIENCQNLSVKRALHSF